MGFSDLLTIAIILFAAGGSWFSLKQKIEDMKKALEKEATSRMALRKYLEAQLTKISRIYESRIKSLEEQIKKHDEILMTMIKKKLSKGV